ncbi:MAG: O-antigen biosynthesis protein WbqP [Sediminicola sp.]|jgi:O-antigen biosynthesis protein WbqP
MIRVLDVFLSITGMLIGLPLMMIVTCIGFFDTGSPFFLQKRVGKNKRPFTLIKFRTMSKNTESVASHLASVDSITKVGKFLRATKLDELPQLWNVILGDMSLVGPRPNLFNQEELIFERDKMGIYNVRPGITGLAQIQNIDMATPARLAEVDEKMIKTMSVGLYFKCIFATVFGAGSGDAVK